MRTGTVGEWDRETTLDVLQNDLEVYVFRPQEMIDTLDDALSWLLEHKDWFADIPEEDIEGLVALFSDEAFRSDLLKGEYGHNKFGGLAELADDFDE